MSGVRASRILSGKTVRVDSTRVAMSKLSFSVLMCSRSGSTLSCRSLLYVDGMPLMVIMRPAIPPNILPHLPRRSSRESPVGVCQSWPLR
ncbi:hypothetical protein ACKS0A_08611 [Histoplasma ohiense]